MHPYVNLMCSARIFFYTSDIKDALLTFNSKECYIYYIMPDIIYYLMLAIPDEGKWTGIMSKQVELLVHCI